jgi:hypothetical protein
MVLQGRIPQGVVAKPPPRTCYCKACTPIRAQLEALRDQLRALQDADDHRHVSSPLRGRWRGRRWPRTPEQRERQRESERLYKERHREQIRARNNRQCKRANSESLEHATRHGQQWTGPEMEIAARNDLPIADLARMLGRTIGSVNSMRHALHTEPKYQQVAGLPERAA